MGSGGEWAVVWMGSGRKWAVAWMGSGGKWAVAWMGCSGKRAVVLWAVAWIYRGVGGSGVNGLGRGVALFRKPRSCETMGTVVRIGMWKWAGRGVNGLSP